MTDRMRRINRIHFVGVGGSGMGGIAEVLLNLGYQVQGSDLKANAVTQRLEQRFTRHGFQAVALLKIAAHDALDFRNVLLRDLSERPQELEYGVIGKLVMHKFSAPCRRHEPRTPQLLEVLGGVGDRQAGSLRQDLDAPLALSQQLEELKAVGMRERLCHSGKLGEQRLFGTLA